MTSVLPVQWIDGAQGRIRTTDTRIFSPLLYQLSYLGIETRYGALGRRHRVIVNAITHSKRFPRRVPASRPRHRRLR